MNYDAIYQARVATANLLRIGQKDLDLNGYEWNILIQAHELFGTMYLDAPLSSFLNERIRWTIGPLPCVEENRERRLLIKFPDSQIFEYSGQDQWSLEPHHWYWKEINGKDEFSTEADLPEGYSWAWI